MLSAPTRIRQAAAGGGNGSRRAGGGPRAAQRLYAPAEEGPGSAATSAAGVFRSANRRSTTKNAGTNRTAKQVDATRA